MTIKSLENSISLRGISGVVLGYSRLDGGTTPGPRRGDAVCSLISLGADLSQFGKRSIKRVHFISYVILPGVCVWIAHMWRSYTGLAQWVWTGGPQ